MKPIDQQIEELNVFMSRSERETVYNPKPKDKLITHKHVFSSFHK